MENNSTKSVDFYFFSVLHLSKFIYFLFHISGSGGQISWDWNSTFSGGQIFDHEVEIQFVHEAKFVH